MSWERFQTVGPVTALYVAPPLEGAADNRSIIYAGIGPDVLAYDLGSGNLLARLESLPTAVVHGFCESQQVSSNAPSRYILAFGQKQLALIESCYECEPKSHSDMSKELIGPGKTTPVEPATEVTHPVCVKLKAAQHIAFSDMVCAVQLLPGDGCAVPARTFAAAVGFAHNFVQVWSLDPTATGEEPTCTHQLQCDVRCLLYSMSFFGTSASNLVVASGTIFNEIVIWDPFGDGVASQRVGGHQGVLFSTTWSDDGMRIASTSDDRTLRMLRRTGKRGCKADILNCEFTPVYTSFGHTARVWNSVFLPSLGPNAVASVAEDGTCCMWDNDGTLLATLRGHVLKNVWSVATNATASILATGGGDGSIKLWDVSHYASRVLIPIIKEEKDPVLSVSGPVPSGKSTSTSTSSATTSATSSSSSSSSQFKLTDAVPPRDSTLETNWLDLPISARRVNAIIADAAFKNLYVATAAGTCIRFHLGSHCSTSQEYASQIFDLHALPSAPRSELGREDPLCCLSLSNDELWLLGGDARGRCHLFSAIAAGTEQITASWKAHQYRCWRVQWEHGRRRAELRTPTKSPSKTMERVITFGAEGTICVWQPGSLEQGTITASIGVPVLQCRAEIGMLPNASMNASLASTSSALTRAPCGGSSLKRNKKRGKRKKNGFTASFSSAIFHNNILFAGDNCGGVSVWSGIECNLHWHMDDLHGRDQVRWIGYHHDYVVSAGCDGRVLMYQVEHSDSSTDVSAEASALRVTRASAEDSSTSTISAATAKAQEARCVKSCLCELKLVQVRKAGAMTAVEAVSWTVSDNMIAVGFLGNFLLVHNITLQYEVFRQECGGWRRPFDVYLQAMPDVAHQGQATVIYVPTHMQRKRKAKQRKMSAPVLSSRVSSASESDASKPFLAIQVCRRHSRTSLWFEKPSLHGFFHGRVATSVCWLGRISDGEKYIFATGGEDNRVILHMFDPSTRGSRIQHIDSSDVHSSAVIAMCMLPKNGASARPHTLLFTVGGNNMLCCWKIFESGVRPPCLHLLCVHRQRNVMKKGTRIDRARDDCRFMSVAAVPTEKDSNSEIVMCGSSQGTVTVFRLDEDSESLVQLHSFCRKGSACKPILCMGHVSCATSGTMLAHHLLFTGSTDGTVAIWDVSWAVRGRPAPAQGIETLQVLTGVHAMGVNTLHVRTARVEREFDSIWLATGGDDNSIRYSHLALRTLGTITHLSTCAVSQACASALKSVWTDGRRMLAVGWNQRLSVWSIQEQLPEQECKLVHETSCFVHVADASSMDVVTGDHGRLTVVVVGQGVEVVSLLPS